jgi:hypothetical protein
MDLFLDRTRPEAVSELRRQIGGFLERHGTDAEAARTGELVVGELLANAFEHSDGDVWVSVDWTGEHPVVAVHDLGPAFAIRSRLPAGGPRAGAGCTWSRAWPVSCGRRRRRPAGRPSPPGSTCAAAARGASTRRGAP